MPDRVEGVAQLRIVGDRACVFAAAMALRRGYEPIAHGREWMVAEMNGVLLCGFKDNREVVEG